VLSRRLGEGKQPEQRLAQLGESVRVDTFTLFGSATLDRRQAGQAQTFGRIGTHGLDPILSVQRRGSHAIHAPAGA
jgi:hypothetical protein